MKSRTAKMPLRGITVKNIKLASNKIGSAEKA
jgi:hypothetical protein